jgi:predicted Zn-dependent protease
LLDETRAETAIGDLLFTQFHKELSKNLEIKEDKKLTEKIKKVAESTSRPEMPYSIQVIRSDVADEIVFPGGKIVLTTGLLESAKDEEQLDFILFRNLMHSVLRHPMKLIKKEGLYAKLLNQIKLHEEKRDFSEIRSITRDYLRSQMRMDHQKADIQGLLLSDSPEKTRLAAIELLKTFTTRIWPVFPMDTGDLPARIEILEKLKLPD